MKRSRRRSSRRPEPDVKAHVARHPRNRRPRRASALTADEQRATLASFVCAEDLIGVEEAKALDEVRD